MAGVTWAQSILGSREGILYFKGGKPTGGVRTVIFRSSATEATILGTGGDGGLFNLITQDCTYLKYLLF